MGFWDSLGKGICAAVGSAEELMAKKICEGDPVRNAPRKVEEIIFLIRKSYNSYYGEYEDEEIHEQRVKQLRIVMRYLKNRAISDREADDVYERIMSRYRSDLSKLGVV